MSGTTTLLLQPITVAIPISLNQDRDLLFRMQYLSYLLSQQQVCVVAVFGVELQVFRQIM